MKRVLIFFALTLAVLTSRAAVVINSSNFPNNTFRQWVSDNCDTDGDGTLSDSELQAVKIINVQNLGISYLKGIEYFTALTVLNCSTNSLTTLNISQNTALKRLMCNNNKLTALNVSANTSLTNINCCNNNIQGSMMTAFINSLPTVSSGNGKLTLVSNVEGDNEQNTYSTANVQAAVAKGWSVMDSYGESLLITLDAVHFPDATFLNYIKQNIDTNHDNILSDEEIAATTHINVNGMGIADLTGVGYFTALEHLYCRRNALTEIDVSKNLELQELYCNDNQLTSLSLFRNDKLWNIICFNNQINSTSMGSLISSLRPAYMGLGGLDICSTQSHEGNAKPTNAQIHQANAKGWLVYEAFSENSEHQLVATGTYIGSNNFPDNAFRSYVASTAVDTDGDGVLSDDERLAVTDINIGGLGVADLTGIAFFPEVTILRAGNNQLTTLDLSPCTKLQRLYCQYNQLTGLDLSPCTQLLNVTCFNNQIGKDAMNRLFFCLPTVSATATIVAYSTAAGEGNAPCNAIQVKEAAEKNWNVEYFDATANATTPFQITLTQGNFPDPAFRSYIYSNIDKNHDNVLSRQEITAVTAINARSYAIADFTGIELFTELKELTTGYVPMDFLDVTRNTKLQTLDCSANQLQRLYVAGTDLRTLRCQRNHFNSDAWQKIINDLPAKSGTAGTLVAFDMVYEENNEVLSAELIAMAGNKNWTIYSCDFNTLTEVKPLEPVEINALNFPDGNFRQFVRNSYDTNHDGTLSTAEIEPVTKMQCQERNIADLTGIGFFTNLRMLNCYGNSLTSLDLSHNKALQVLYCGVNSLTSLDLSHNRALRTLNVECNRLTALDLSNNIAIQSLNVESNELMAPLDLSHNPDLTSLCCNYINFSPSAVSAIINALPNAATASHAQLTINHDAVSPLQVYDARRKNWNVNYFDTEGYRRMISNMGLGDVAIDDQRFFPDAALRTYVSENIDTNHDGTLTADEAAVVTDLNVSGLNIANLHGTGFFRNLQTLRCNDNQLTSLNLSFFNFLKRVECYRNKIGNQAMDNLFESLRSKIPGDGAILIPTHTGSGEFNATVTDQHIAEAGNNRWTVYSYNGSSYTTMQQSQVPINADNFPDNHFRQWVANIADTDGNLSLSYQERSNVRSISLIDSALADLTGIAYFTELTKLYVTSNGLTTLDLTSCTKLGELYCAFNQLTDLRLPASGMLHTLNCAYNQLTNLDLSHQQALVTLGCADNQLTNLSPRHCPMLRNLFCDNNALAMLDLTRNADLEVLSCSNTLLRELNVAHNTGLTTLHCDGNQLTTLDLSSCIPLKVLDIHQNNIYGEGMDNLIGSLPERTDNPTANEQDHILYMIDICPDSGDHEHNLCTQAQADACIAKGWTLKARVRHSSDGDNWCNWLGPDNHTPTAVTTPETTKQPSTAAADNYYYSLDGRRINQKPHKPGIYIHNGKKVVVK